MGNTGGSSSHRKTRGEAEVKSQSRRLKQMAEPLLLEEQKKIEHERRKENSRNHPGFHLDYYTLTKMQEGLPREKGDTFT